MYFNAVSAQVEKNYIENLYRETNNLTSLLKAPKKTSCLLRMALLWSSQAATWKFSCSYNYNGALLEIVSFESYKTQHCGLLKKFL